MNSDKNTKMFILPRNTNGYPTPRCYPTHSNINPYNTIQQFNLKNAFLRQQPKQMIFYRN